MEDEGEGLWSVAAVVCRSMLAIAMEVGLGPVSEGTGLVEGSVAAERRTSRDDETVLLMDEECSGGELCGLEGPVMGRLSVGGEVWARCAWGWSGPRLSCGVWSWL